jgi:hypothetical protein
MANSKNSAHLRLGGRRAGAQQRRREARGRAGRRRGARCVPPTTPTGSAWRTARCRWRCCTGRWLHWCRPARRSRPAVRGAPGGFAGSRRGQQAGSGRRLQLRLTRSPKIARARPTGCDCRPMAITMDGCGGEMAGLADVTRRNRCIRASACAAGGAVGGATVGLTRRLRSREGEWVALRAEQIGRTGRVCSCPAGYQPRRRTGAHRVWAIRPCLLIRAAAQYYARGLGAA